MRTPYLVIIDSEKSFLYTDKRKINKLFKINRNIKVYIFKTIKCNHWEDIYELHTDNKETKVEMFKNNNITYSDLGCHVMKSLAKAEWNSSIKYPDNGWHICSVCGDITNEISECWYCEEFVCWDCKHGHVDIDWEDGDFCSYDCYRNYLEKEYDIEYNPELEYEESILDRIEYILERFNRDELVDILTNVELSVHDEEELNEVKLKYANMTEEELLSLLNRENDNDIYDVLIELYENETDEYLSELLEGEAFINNLDPNDSADAWFFED